MCAYRSTFLLRSISHVSLRDWFCKVSVKKKKINFCAEFWSSRCAWSLEIQGTFNSYTHHQDVVWVFVILPMSFVCACVQVCQSLLQQCLLGLLFCSRWAHIKTPCQREKSSCNYSPLLSCTYKHRLWLQALSALFSLSFICWLTNSLTPPSHAVLLWANTFSLPCMLSVSLCLSLKEKYTKQLYN